MKEAVLDSHKKSDNSHSQSNKLNNFIVGLISGILITVFGDLILDWVRIQITIPEYPLQGTWINQNPETGGLTRIRMSSSLNRLYINMWGKCHPTDCDWGEMSVSDRDARDKRFKITWNHGFSIVKQKIIMLPDGRIKVFGITKFTDDSERPDYESTYYFERKPS